MYYFANLISGYFPSYISFPITITGAQLWGFLGGLEDLILKMITKCWYFAKLLILQYFGHLIRRNNIHRVLLEGKINGKRERGRPGASWANNIIKWTGFNYSDTMRTEQDRHRWKVVSRTVERGG